MEISFTDNLTRRLADVLNPALAEATTVKFAVAFMKHSGLSIVEDSLKVCLANDGHAEFLVGLDFRTTEPKPLRTLLDLANAGYRVDSYCFSDPSAENTPVYHPKLYLMINAARAVIVVGSSNLTRGGLKSNAEVNTVIRADLTEEVVSDIWGLYTRLKFRQSRFRPSLEYIQAYEEAYKRVQRKDAEAIREPSIKLMIEDLKVREKVMPKPVPTPQDLFGWQKIVHEKLPFGPFRTSHLYAYEKDFQQYYPGNRNVRAKVRQILQQLRAIGLLANPHKDKWERI